MTRQLRSLAAVGFFLAVFIVEVRQAIARVGSLARLMLTQTGKQGCRLSFDTLSPALPDGEYPAPGHFRIGQLATILLPDPPPLKWSDLRYL